MEAPGDDVLVRWNPRTHPAVKTHWRIHNKQVSSVSWSWKWETYFALHMQTAWIRNWLCGKHECLKIWDMIGGAWRGRCWLALSAVALALTSFWSQREIRIHLIYIFVLLPVFFLVVFSQNDKTCSSSETFFPFRTTYWRMLTNRQMAI